VRNRASCGEEVKTGSHRGEKAGGCCGEKWVCNKAEQVVAPTVGGRRPLRPALCAGRWPPVVTALTAGGNRTARSAERRGLRQPGGGYGVDPGLRDVSMQLRRIGEGHGATDAWGGSGDGTGRLGRRMRSSSPGKPFFLQTTVSGAQAEVGQWGTVRGGTGVGGWSCGSGVAGDAVGVGLEVGLG